MNLSALKAAQGYSASRPATHPQNVSDGGRFFRETVSDLVNSVQTAEAASIASMTGKGDPHSMVLALSQAELAVETAVTIRDRVVEAYQEILRMPV